MGLSRGYVVRLIYGRHFGLLVTKYYKHENKQVITRAQKNKH